MEAHVDHFLGEVSGRKDTEVERKRDRLQAKDDETVNVKRPRTNGALKSAKSALSRAQIDQLLEQAEASAHEVTSLDARSLKALVQSLEKKIRKNAMLRAKFADQPEKFMDSEVALAEELGKLKELAAQPKLYNLLVELDTIPTVLGLFSHENLDIRLEVISLIAELADAEALDADEQELEAMNQLVMVLIQNKFLPLLVNTLWRLEEHRESSNKETNASSVPMTQEKEDEDEAFQGIHNGFQIIESFADLAPQLTSQDLGQNTTILSFIMLQVHSKREFTPNKLYASEILSILLQSDSSLQHTFVTPRSSSSSKSNNESDKHHEDLMDNLLRAVAPYRKKDPEHEEEEEFLENLINSLCSVLLTSKGQQRFRHLEGLELMLRCLQDRKFIRHGALRVVDHALSESKRNCERFVEVGGLKHIFPALMGKGRYKRSKKSSLHMAKTSLEQEEEHILGILTSLCDFLNAQSPQDALERFHAKFLEKEFEKVDRLVDLYEKYHRRISQVPPPPRPGSAQERYEAMVEVYREKRLEVGLFSLQRICMLLAHLIGFSLKVRAYTEVKFHERGLEIRELQGVLNEQLQLLKEVEDDDVDNEEKEYQQQVELKRRRLEMLIGVLDQPREPMSE